MTRIYALPLLGSASELHLRRQGFRLDPHLIGPERDHKDLVKFFGKLNPHGQDLSLRNRLRTHFKRSLMRMRARVDYPALKASVKNLAQKWGATRVLVEDTAAGTALVQELVREIPGT